MTEVSFPTNIVEVLADAIANVDGVNFVERRLIRKTDGDGTVGIAASSWVPIDQEIGVPEPMGRYTIFISTLKNNTDEPTGRHDSSLLVKNIRLLLYRNEALQIALRGLSETSLGFTERVSQVKVRQQRYMDESLQNAFLFISVTQLDVDTSIV